MKLIGKGHRHKTTQAKVKLREVVEIAKTFEANTFANQLMKSARNTQQEQVKYTTKSPQSSQCFWCGGKHQQPRQPYCPASVQGGTRQQARQQQSNFARKTQKRKPSLQSVIRPNGLRENILLICNLNMERKQKSCRSTLHPLACNTISSTLLRKLIPNAEIRRTRSKINTYGSDTMRPEGQVTLCCERRGRIRTSPCGKRST